MATASGLMGVGVPDEVAKRTGVTIVSVTTTAATQGSAGGLLKGDGNKAVLATPAGSNGAVTLPSAAGLGDEIEVYNLDGSNAVRVFPQSGGTINNGTANAHLDITAAGSSANSGIRLRKMTATNWRTVG
jgi:hypothetical protein